MTKDDLVSKDTALKIGIAFEYTDGTKDFFDPVDENEFYSNQTENEYHIDVGCYKYIVWKPNVLSMRKYELCAGCGKESGDGHYCSGGIR